MATDNNRPDSVEEKTGTVEECMAALDRVMSGEVDKVTDPIGDIVFQRITKRIVAVKIGNRSFLVTKKGKRKSEGKDGSR